MKNPPNATSEKSTNSVRDEPCAVHVAETEICGNQSATFRDGWVAYVGRFLCHMEWGTGPVECPLWLKFPCLCTVISPTL